MSKNTTVSLTLQIKGQQASQEMKRISDQQVTATTKINQQWTQIGNAQAKFVNTAKAGTRETINTARAGDQLLRTNRMLEGVLRQQSIQTKLQGQLYKQNVASAQQLANWTKQIEQSSKRTQQHVQQTAGSMGLLQKGGAIAGGVVGAGYALQQPIKRTVDYDRDVHYAAQKLSSNPENWKETKKWINTIVVGNAINGGVDRDTSFLAMDRLLSDGAYNDNNEAKMKQNLARAHFEAAKSALASGGDIADFADVGLAAKKRNLNEALVQAMVIKADDLGAMGAKDVAKALPAQLGKLPLDKVNGQRQVAQLIALNEIAMNTAGNASEADTNVNNFLSKMYSSDTIQRLKKQYKVNLPERYAKGKDSGKTDFDVFSDIVDEIISKDKNSQSLVKKIQGAKDNKEKIALLETQQAIFEQSGLAGILPDMQALMALVASKRYGGNWETLTNTAMTEGMQTRDLKFNYNQKELPSYGFNAFDVTRKNAEFQTLDGTVKSLGEMGTKVAELTAKYPALITVMGSTELALKTLTIAAGGASIALLANGKKPPTIGGFPSTTVPPQIGGNSSSTKVGVGGAAGLVGAAYAGSQFIKPYDDAGYNFISQMLSKIGIGDGSKSPDFVQQAIDKSKEQQALLQQQLTEQQKQNQQSERVIQALSDVKGAITANKPVFNFGGSLLDGISQNAQQQEKRHGAFIPWRIGS